jgi:hypothetical protein
MNANILKQHAEELAYYLAHPYNYRHKLNTLEKSGPTKEEHFAEVIEKAMLDLVAKSTGEEVQPLRPLPVTEAIEFLRTIALNPNLSSNNWQLAESIAASLHQYYAKENEPSQPAIPVDIDKTLDETVARAFEVYSSLLGWNLTPYQSECWAALDSAITELARRRAEKSGDIVLPEKHDLVNDLRQGGRGLEQAQWVLRDLASHGYVIYRTSRPLPVEAYADDFNYVANSLAQMVSEWIEVDIKTKTNWRDGLTDIIRARLRRLDNVLGATPDRHMKKALFQCIKLGLTSRQYGGVLISKGKYAYIRFSIEDGANESDVET